MAAGRPRKGTPYDQAAQKMGHGAPLRAREDRHRSRRPKAAKVGRQGVYDGMNADSEFAGFGSRMQPVEISGTIGHHGERMRGSRNRLAKGTARGVSRMTRDDIGGSRLMLLYTTTGYEAREFVRTARDLGVEMLLGSDRCDVLNDPWEDDAVALRFHQPEEAANRIVDRVSRHPVDAILPVGDTPLLSAAQASKRLGMVHNSPDAVLASRNKYLMRLRLQAAGARVPAFKCFPMQTDPHLIKHEVPYPCVVKPLALSASQGVIRANTPEDFVAAFQRVRALLERPEMRGKVDEANDGILVERFIPGVEVALEGLVTGGRLQTLALFDKPDPLNGPYFEETIYVTPSRLHANLQATITQCAEQAALALGLCHGPVHAEFRINDQGPWLLELAPRPIGGL